MTALANALAILCFFAACFRARWVALALAPPVLLILASWAGIVDLSSASHPARWIVPLVGAVGAAGAGLKASLDRVNIPPLTDNNLTLWLSKWSELLALKRAFYASLLVFGSDCIDLVALHPKIWEIPGVWAITPIQIIVCVSVGVVLLAPERWLLRCLK